MHNFNHEIVLLYKPCTRGMRNFNFHLRSPGCRRPSIALHCEIVAWNTIHFTLKTSGTRLTFLFTLAGFFYIKPKYRFSPCQVAEVLRLSGNEGTVLWSNYSTPNRLLDWIGKWEKDSNCLKSERKKERDTKKESECGKEERYEWVAQKREWKRYMLFRFELMGDFVSFRNALRTNCADC